MVRSAMAAVSWKKMPKAMRVEGMVDVPCANRRHRNQETN
jgi:hypothetical protein